MKGIELAKKFFVEYGEEMLKSKFPDAYERMTIGLVGEGSECLGFDDEFSKDHDFEPGFCIFIDEEDEKEIGFALERAYAKLPKEFEGLSRKGLMPAGGQRRGVFVTSEFFEKYLGIPHAPLSPREWFRAEQHNLALLSAGEIFHAGKGKFMEQREIIQAGYPEDIRKKKIAACLAVMSQAGQYNYARAIDREESGAAQLALFEFVKSTINVVYLLNNKYCPFYKWAFRGMRDLSILSDLEMPLVYLIENPNDADFRNCKREMVEDIATSVIAELKAQKLTDATCNNLDTHAFSVSDKIKDGNIRNLNVFVGEN